MSIPRAINLYRPRPLQAREFGTQAAELGLDPRRRSPIEVAMGYALLELMLDSDEFGPPNFHNLFFPHCEIAALTEMPPITGRKFGVINIAPGCWVDSYQSDFLIEARAPGSTKVSRGTLECDGHFFHDRTPEQASHDRQRDRNFQDMGILVLRFTAVDITDRPKHCAREAIKVLLRASSIQRRAA